MSENSHCQASTLLGISSKIAIDIKMAEFEFHLLLLQCVCFYNVMASTRDTRDMKCSKGDQQGKSQEKGFPKKSLGC